MYALCLASWLHMHTGLMAEAQPLIDELAALADEKDATLFWKATEIAYRGALFAETGNASDAVRAITSGMTSFGQLEQLFMNRGICPIWQWLTRNLASLTMLGVALTTR